MSTVAIAAGSPAVGHRSEADVVRSAARSDRAAFDELYRRHYQASWRLAQAVATGDDAASAVADGFVGVLRGTRRHRSLAEEPFRPQLLAATYRAGMEPSKAAGDVTGPAGAPTAVAAAFRSLPDRWRAALWLSDVEHLTAPSLAAVLGVSAPVAAQLAERGRHGLLTRFAQVGVAEPEHLDSVLRPLAGSPPEGLEALAAKRWRSSVAVDPGGRLVPMTTWLSTRAPRPLWAACGGLLALGLVGLGVLTVAAPPSTTGPAAPISAPGFNTTPPANPSTPPGHAELFGPGSGSNQYGLLPAGDSTNPILAGEGSPSAMTGTPASLPTGAGTGTAASTANPTSGTSPSSGGTSTSPSKGGNSPSSPSTPKTPSTTTGSSSTPVLTVPGVASVSTPSGGGTTIDVGSSSSPVASATLTPTCVGLQVLNLITDKCTTPTSSTGTGTNAASQLGTDVNSSLTGLLGSLGLEK